MIAQSVLEGMPGVHSVEQDAVSPTTQNQDLVMLPGPVRGSFVVYIDGEEYHASMEDAWKLIWGIEPIVLRSRPEIDTGGYIPITKDTIPMGKAIASRSGLSVGIYAYLSRQWYVTPLDWVTRVTAGRLASSPIKMIGSDEVLP